MTHVQKKTYRNKTVIQMAISSFMFLFMSFLEIYWMINRSYEYFILIIIGLLIFIFGFLIIHSIVKKINFHNEKLINQYEEILKADKAVYLLVKKSVSEIKEEIAEISVNKTPVSEIVERQKSIAKLTISKNRQSTEELLNLNSKVLEELEKVLQYVEINTSNTEKNIENKTVPKLYDDPNANLTPAEIAALFESMGT